LTKIVQFLANFGLPLEDFLYHFLHVIREIGIRKEQRKLITIILDLLNQKFYKAQKKTAINGHMMPLHTKALNNFKFNI
jgi:hypothetical protein